MPRKKITGRIIRILDTRTVIINLGRESNVKDSSIFHILGEPEPVVDPFTEEELGRVRVVKARVKASQVYDKFTVATSKWTKYYSQIDLVGGILGHTEVVDEGELRVEPDDVKPWRARSEVPVRGIFTQKVGPSSIVKT